MRRAIIHIGTPRTGTTSLQAVLSANRGTLAEIGVLYPELTPRSAAGAPHLSHQYLGEALDGRRPRRERTELLATLDGQLAQTHADIAILSYEGFCLLPPWSRVPARLVRLFARHGFATEILLTVKAQALYAQSQYTWRCQFLREHRRFAEALPGILRLRRFDYNACLAIWARAAGGRVHAVPVHDRRSDAPLVERILGELGIAERLGPGVTLAELGRRDNPSPGATTIEVLRRLRSQGVVSFGTADPRAVTEFIAAQIHARGLADPPFQALDAATVERVAARFAGRNERFARRVWGEGWGERVAAVPVGGVTEVGEVEEIEDVVRLVGARHCRLSPPPPL